MKFHWITIVWGKRYTELFVNLVIPSQLSSGNLPALKHRGESIYKIYAPAADIDTIRRSASFARLSSLVSVQFIEIADIDEQRLMSWPYDFMTVCHKHAYEEAVSTEAAAIFLAPDAILSDGSFAAVERRALEGYSLLLTSALHAALENGRPWIEQRCTEPDGSVRLSSHDAVALTRKHPQFHIENLMVSGGKFANGWPSSMWIPVSQHSMVSRAWHLHPILARSKHSAVSAETVDSGQFLEAAAARNESVYVFRDSKEFCVVELSAYKQRGSFLKEATPFSADEVAEWVDANTGPASRALARTSFLFDGGDANSDEIAQADQVLTEHIDAVLSRTTSPIRTILPIDSASEIDRTRPTYFYGSGAFGQRLLEEMNDLGAWRFQGFIDSRQSGVCRGFPVLDLEQFQAAYRPGDQIVISSMYLTQISKALGQLGISEAKDATGWYRARQHADRIGTIALRPLALESCEPEKVTEYFSNTWNKMSGF